MRLLARSAHQAAKGVAGGQARVLARPEVTVRPPGVKDEPQLVILARRGEDPGLLLPLRFISKISTIPAS
eukprot:7580642-Pyramimonas_sp.AAC.1